MKYQIKHVAILIPARNEEKLLPRCINSIIDARKNLANDITVDIILSVDASTDETYAIGQELLKNHGSVISLNEGNVGHARKLAAEHAFSRFKAPDHQCWLANTDADCKVPSNWLTYQLQKAATGINVIAGIIKVDSYEEHHNEVANIFLKEYTLNSDGTHPHVHGANFGIRGDIYKKFGGWGQLETAEDHDLWNRLVAEDVNKDSDSKLFVYTSGRRIGRAPHGFAQTLASFNKAVHDGK